MSSRAKAEYKKLEREREQWEFENNPEGEIEEMIDLYKDEGIEEEDAKMIIMKMAKYKELFLDVMTVQELKLTMDDLTLTRTMLVSVPTLCLSSQSF